ncbi:MAG: glycosyltransferase family 2 protein [Candidatus Omnitrophica bacterium]|nr:glycosyltransferase family 2 protein [Candidatus Omnitrophota bacterium]
MMDVIIISWNSREKLRRLLISLHDQYQAEDRLIIIDNGSTDGTTDMIKEVAPGAFLIRNHENLGFCKAVNQGIHASVDEYILILNSDIVAYRDFIARVKEGVKQYSKERVGMFGVKMLQAHSNLIDSTGLTLSWAYRFFDRGFGETDNGQYDDKKEIFGPCGGCAVYQRVMLEDIREGDEYFDEDFFFLGEDFDVAWRARHKGWTARYIPEAICWHERGGSFDQKYRQYLSFRNRYFLLLKNASPRASLPAIFLLYDFPRLFYLLCTNRYTPKALLELKAQSGKMLAKRKRLLGSTEPLAHHHPF